MDKDKTLKIDDYTTPSDRFVGWLKSNLDNFALALICVVYVLRGVLTIETSDKTVLEILADGAVSLLGAFLIKMVLDKKGILKGLISPKFVATTNVYGIKKTEISGFVEELDPFCNKKNEENLKQARKEFLLNYSMNYDLYAKGHYDNDETKKDIIKECRKIKVFKYTPTLLTNAYDNSKNEQELLTATIEKYEKQQRLGDVALGIAIFLLFSYFVPGKNAIDAANTLWYALQVALFLAFGMVKYMNSFYFVSEKLRGKINRVIDILDEFINIREKNVGIFKVEYETAKDDEPAKEPIKQPIPVYSTEEVKEAIKEYEAKENLEAVL